MLIIFVSLILFIQSFPSLSGRLSTPTPLAIASFGVSPGLPISSGSASWTACALTPPPTGRTLGPGSALRLGKHWLLCCSPRTSFGPEVRNLS